MLLLLIVLLLLPPSMSSCLYLSVAELRAAASAAAVASKLDVGLLVRRNAQVNSDFSHILVLLNTIAFLFIFRPEDLALRPWRSSGGWQRSASCRLNLSVRRRHRSLQEPRGSKRLRCIAWFGNSEFRSASFSLNLGGAGTARGAVSSGGPFKALCFKSLQKAPGIGRKV